MQFDIIASDLGFTEGPAWAPDGTLWCVSITHASLYHFTPEGEIIERVEVGGGPNGLVIDAEGAVFIAQNGGVYGGKPGTEPGIQVLRNGELSYIVRGGEPDAPNDLCFGPDGRLYFTDPRGDDDPDPEDASTSRPGKLFSCERDGSDLTMHWEGPVLMNGLAFTAEGDALLVIQTMTPQPIWRLPFDLEKGLGEPEEFTRVVDGWPDGMAIDLDGQLWVGTNHDCSVQVFDKHGTFVARHPLPEGTNAANVCFGGPNLDVLYVAGSGGGTVLRADAEVSGLPLRG
ncbi:SMP-30/gluconolactonase/LRE family protein [soil metagenome]